MQTTPIPMPVPTLPRSLHGSRATLWTIYRSPEGPPARYAVRRWRAIEGTFGPVADPEPSFTGDTLAGARLAVPFEAAHLLHRSPDDDPSIVETWY